MAAAFAENAKALRDPSIPEEERRWMGRRIDTAWLALHKGKEAVPTLAKFWFLEAVDTAASQIGEDAEPSEELARHALKTFASQYATQAARLTQEDMLKALAVWNQRPGPKPDGPQQKEQVLLALMKKMGIPVRISADGKTTDLLAELRRWRRQQQG